MRYLRGRAPRVVWDAASGQYVAPYEALTRLGEVRTELQVVDARERCVRLLFFCFVCVHC